MRKTNLHKAVQHASEIEIMPVDLIEFNSSGRLLIVGRAQQILAVTPHLSGLIISAVITDDETVVNNDNITLINDRITTIDGWLGEFSVQFESQQLKVDLVLDLSEQAIMTAAVLPLGYFAPQDNAQVLVETLQQLPDLVGTFDKPRYFNYKASICAHSRRQLSGCEQCLNACPADAIISSGDTVTVNPSLCQGCGSCTAVCPSGAISYALPTLDVSLNRARKMIQAWFEFETVAPHIVIHDLEQGQLLIDNMGESLANNILTFSIEEIGALSMPFWLSVLAYGASGITVWDAGSHRNHSWLELQQEIDKTNQMLIGMGYEQQLVNWLTTNDFSQLNSHLSTTNSLEGMQTATFAGIEDKRRMISIALEHLHKHAPKTIDVLALDEQSAFGKIKVNTKTCTLCHSCVSVCPVGAVLDGVDQPQLNFIEDLCVQCGLCETACPEDAIGLVPRYLFDREQARKVTLLHEEAVFNCISCDKPFATKKMIDTMMDKLKGHSMFQGAALDRLKMCEDCRVKAMFKNSQGPM
ncbi:MAG: 4Fe-4S dicluster domain-containing protein [Methylophaga sp.]|nr:4Fe-4S dicluster domain-containing protein [Methylophaga sp.]